METTPFIVCAAICAVILFFVARVVLKRNKQAMQLEENLNKDELFTLKQETTGNDVFEEPEEQRFIPDEEIENYTDEHKKEWAMVSNYLIKNEIKNLGKIEFYDLQESILLYEFGESVNNFTVDHIYQIAENRYVAVIGLTDLKTEVQDQEKSPEKQIMGIIECLDSLGNGRVKPYEFKEETTDASGVFLETETLIGDHILIHEGYADVTGIEALCSEINKLNTDYVAYINGKTIYIRINRPAALTDLKTMIEILKNYQY